MMSKPRALSDRRIVLGLLLLSYASSYIDRSIIGILAPAIKSDLKLTDTQLGLLGGFYFALLYTLLGIPIARLAERAPRTEIIAFSMIVWSGFTAACGAATSFGALAFCRFGVGFGEAGCSPPAHSLISDYFPPERRSLALSIYTLGLPIGTMIGAVAGGWLGQAFSWQTAFVVIGLPGVVIGLAIRSFIVEPRWLLLQPAPPRRALRRLIADEAREAVAVALVLMRNRPVVHMMIGMTLGAFVVYGLGQFAPAYFIRTFGLSLRQAGLITGLVGGSSAAIGTLAGGYFGGRLGQRSPIWFALLPAIGLLTATPLYAFAYSVDSWQVATAVLFLPGIFAYSNFGPTFGYLQNSVQPSQRATATALLFFLVNLVALAIGPVFVGWVIDRSADMLVSGQVGTFQHLCPGGAAPTGSLPTTQASCRATLAIATRIGVLSAVALYLWASLHYFLSALAIRRQSTRA